MSNFYIKKIVASGIGKEDSVIDLTVGLNIIKGPSNTGKTYVLKCIDFLFGSGDDPFLEADTGYSVIKMYVETPKGNISLERNLGNSKIKVSSMRPDIESGDYTTKTGKRCVNNDLWPVLIGIQDKHQIISTEDFQKRRLTWRSILHMFLLKIGATLKDTTILNSGNWDRIDTGALSSLLFLITGNDYSELEQPEDKDIKTARKKAVIEYINKRLVKFAQRRDELAGFDVRDSLSIQKKVEDIISEITRTEQEIIVASNRNNQVLKELYELQESLTQCDTLCGRYTDLKMRYSADLKRLAFIAEGELHKHAMESNEKCPFCDNHLSKRKETTYFEATRAELRRIELQLADLIDAEKDLLAQRFEIEHRIVALSSERNGIIALIDNELKPRAETLKQSLVDYKKAVEIQSEVDAIGRFELSMKTELYEKEHEEESDKIFKVKTYFTSEMMRTFDGYLEKILKACKFKGYNTAHLSTSNFDIMVNGKAKNSNGEGYSAFLNTVLAIALMEYLEDNGIYKPGWLMVDSPILTLQERDGTDEANSIKRGLFQYLLNNQSYGQVIILEQDIPELDYEGKANIICFTQDETKGRYGFLNGVRHTN